MNATAPFRTASGVPIFDVVIVGAGATGLAAAIEAVSLGWRTAVLERGLPGGAAAALARVEPVPGHPVGLAGTEFMARALTQAQRFGARVETQDDVIGLTTALGAFEVRRSSGARTRARSVIVTTGVERDLPPTPGFAELFGVGVHIGAPADFPATLRGRDVVVAGPLVLAGSAALRLSDLGGSVTVVTIDTLRAPGVSASLRTALRARGNVRVLSRTEIVCAAGVDRLESVVLQHTKTGRITALEATALFLLLPGVPRTAWLPAGVTLDSDGFVLTGTDVATMPEWPLTRAPHPFETTLPGLFAAGEIRRGALGGAAALTDGVATGNGRAAPHCSGESATMPGSSSIV